MAATILRVVERAMSDLDRVRVRLNNINTNDYGYEGPASAVLSEMGRHLYAARELYGRFLRANGLP